MNKHGKFNTVIRLFDKHELSYNSPRDEYTEKMRSQYEYAKDNIVTLGIPLGGGSGSSSGAFRIGDAANMSAENLWMLAFSKS